MGWFGTVAIGALLYFQVATEWFSVAQRGHRTPPVGFPSDHTKPWVVVEFINEHLVFTSDDTAMAKLLLMTWVYRRSLV